MLKDFYRNLLEVTYIVLNFLGYVVETLVSITTQGIIAITYIGVVVSILAAAKMFYDKMYISTLVILFITLLLLIIQSLINVPGKKKGGK